MIIFYPSHSFPMSCYPNGVVLVAIHCKIKQSIRRQKIVHNAILSIPSCFLSHGSKQLVWISDDQDFILSYLNCKNIFFSISPSDLEADDEDNQDLDSLNQSDSTVSSVPQCRRPGTPTGENSEEVKCLILSLFSILI